MEALKRGLDAWMERYVAAERIPCAACAVLVDGETVYKRHFGWADKEGRRLHDSSDVFRMYSCTKAVTAVAALQLLEQGLWSLDDPVTKFLPVMAQVPGVMAEGGQLEPLERPITMRHLLTHTSGVSYSIMPNLTDGRPNPVSVEFREAMLDQSTSLEDLVNRVAAVPLVNQPGTTWNYGFNIDIVGRVVEVLSGMPLDVYFEQNIFRPLGMTSTCFRPRAAPEMKARLVHLYSANFPAIAKYGSYFFKSDFSETPRMLKGHFMYGRFSEGPNDYTVAGPVALEPGGGLLSTLDDWVLFTECLRKGGSCPGAGRRILQPGTAELMATDLRPPGCLTHPSMRLVCGRGKEDPGYGHGLGVVVAVDPEGRGRSLGPGVGSIEWGGMASTIFWADPGERVSVVFLTQIFAPDTYPLRSELKELVYTHLRRAHAAARSLPKSKL